MKLLVVLVCIVVVAGFLYLLLSAWLQARAGRDGPWHVETVTHPDGSLAVIVRHEESAHARTVRELPADMDSIDLASELRLAREDARLQADELNRSP